MKLGNMYYVDREKNSSLGDYECLAKNRLSSDRRLLFLSFLVKQCLDNEKVIRKPEIEWKIWLIIGACSFLARILFVCALMCFCTKFGQKDDRCKNSKYDDVCARATQNVGSASENEEIRLHHTSGRSGNEGSLHSEEYKLPVDVNVENYVYYNESTYQELSEFRETDEERYQSLNPIDS